MSPDHITDTAKWLRDQPRVAKFLLILLDRAGSPVQHEEAAALIGHKGVSANGTARAVAHRLRTALDDRMGAGTWIEAVYGRGYRVTKKAARRILEEMERDG